MEITLEKIAEALSHGKISYRHAERILNHQIKEGTLNMTVAEANLQIRKLQNAQAASAPQWKLELKSTMLIAGN